MGQDHDQTAHYRNYAPGPGLCVIGLPARAGKIQSIRAGAGAIMDGRTSAKRGDI